MIVLDELESWGVINSVTVTDVSKFATNNLG